MSAAVIVHFQLRSRCPRQPLNSCSIHKTRQAALIDAARKAGNKVAKRNKHNIHKALLYYYSLGHGSNALLRVQTNCPRLQPQNYQPVFHGNALARK